MKDTLACLEMGAVETLIVWENLDCDRFELLNTGSGEKEVGGGGRREEAGRGARTGPRNGFGWLAQARALVRRQVAAGRSALLLACRGHLTCVAPRHTPQTPR